MADILTRWTRGHRVNLLFSKHVLSILRTAEQVVPAVSSIVWPAMSDIRDAQREVKDVPSNLRYGENGLLCTGKNIWVPLENNELKLRILMAAHCGDAGHRGADATASAIREVYNWKGLQHDVDVLVHGCIHCLISSTGETIPRPLASQLHGSRPNEVVHLDFLYMGPSSTGDLYLLLLKEDFLSFVWLFPFASATAETGVEALSSWVATFGCMDYVISDQGAHFKNRLLAGLVSELHANHHFTTPYSPWANGTIERVCREVLRASRALLSELGLAAQDWPSVVEIVQSVVNHSSLRRLGPRKDDPGVFRCPLEVLTACKPKRPLLRSLPISPSQKVVSLEQARAQQFMKIESLQSAIEGMHRDVEQRVTSARKKAIERHKQRTNVQAFGFQTGDFVLVRKAQKKGHKLSFLWKDPRLVLEETSHCVYEVKNLVSGKNETVQARRLRMYRADMIGKRVEDELLRIAAHTEASYQQAESIYDICEKEGGISVKIQWAGLPKALDYTWEPLQQVAEDLPQMLSAYLATKRKKHLRKRLKPCANKIKTSATRTLHGALYSLVGLRSGLFGKRTYRHLLGP